MPSRRLRNPAIRHQRRGGAQRKLPAGSSLYGEVRLFDVEGKNETRVAPGAVVVRARRDGDGFTSSVPIPVVTPSYEIVLPPGTYSLWKAHVPAGPARFASEPGGQTIHRLALS